MRIVDIHLQEQTQFYTTDLFKVCLSKLWRESSNWWWSYPTIWCAGYRIHQSSGIVITFKCVAVTKNEGYTFRIEIGWLQFTHISLTCGFHDSTGTIYWLQKSKKLLKSQEKPTKLSNIHHNNHDGYENLHNVQTLPMNYPNGFVGSYSATSFLRVTISPVFSVHVFLCEVTASIVKMSTVHRYQLRIQQIQQLQRRENCISSEKCNLHVDLVRQ